MFDNYKLHTRQDIDNYILDNQIELLIFDCDGTLIDTLGMHYEAWNDAYAKLKRKFVSKGAFVSTYAGMNPGFMVMHIDSVHNQRTDSHKVGNLQYKIFTEHYYPNAKPITEVAEIATDYHKKGMKMVVASGGDRHTVKSLLKISGIDHLFLDVLTIEDVEEGKPSPDLFELAANRQSVPYAKCLVFEDSDVGFIAAYEAKMPYVNIHWLLPRPKK